MTAKKTRRSLDDSLANEFVFGTTEPAAVASVPVAPVPAVPVGVPIPETVEFPQLEEPAPVKKPRSPKPSKPAEPKTTLLSKLMDGSEKEATIRLTVDLPESMHKKLSMLSARTGKKKAVIVRMLLEEALEQAE